MATLVQRINDLATRIGQEIKAVRTEMAGLGGGGTQQIYVQQTRPVAAGPWVWWQTDADGELIDCIVNDGA